MLLVAGCSFAWGDELIGSKNKPPTHHDLVFGSILSLKLDLEYNNISACGNCNYKIFRDIMNNIHLNPSHIFILWSDPLRKENLLEVDNTQRDLLKVYTDMSMTQWHENRWEDLLLSMDKDIAYKWSRTHTFNELTSFRRTEKAIDAYGTGLGTGVTHLLPQMIAMQYMCDAMGIKISQGVFHSGVFSDLQRYMARIESFPSSNQLKKWNTWVLDSLDKLRPENKLGLDPDKSFEENVTIKSIMGDRPMKKWGHPDETAHVDYAEYLYKIIKNL